MIIIQPTIRTWLLIVGSILATAFAIYFHFKIRSIKMQQQEINQQAISVNIQNIENTEISENQK